MVRLVESIPEGNYEQLAADLMDTDLEGSLFAAVVDRPNCALDLTWADSPNREEADSIASEAVDMALDTLMGFVRADDRPYLVNLRRGERYRGVAAYRAYVRAVQRYVRETNRRRSTRI